MYKYEKWDIVAEVKTNSWVITILLEKDLAPITTNNFIGLATSWYYDGVIFHRIIKWFMIQWWDPDGTWMWGTSIYWEKFVDEFHPELRNFKYTISMANAWPNTNWSQFFINVADNNYLDDKHSVFWEVVDWVDNVDKLSKVKTDSSDRPEKEVKIISVKIKEYNWASFKDYDFDKESALKTYENFLDSKKEAKKSMKIWVDSIVKVHYTWTFEDWEKFDSSYDRWEALEFVAWSGQMIPGFDKAVLWMSIWEKKSITLSPAEAYWEYSEDNRQVVPRLDLKTFEDNGIELKAWNVLPTQFWPLTIIDVTEENVVIDTNHKLAWKTLNFDLEIVDIS